MKGKPTCNWTSDIPKGMFPTYNLRAWRVIWLPCGKLLTVPPGTGPPAFTGICPAADISDNKAHHNEFNIMCKIQVFYFNL